MPTWREPVPNRKTRPTSREICGFFTFHKWEMGKWVNNQFWKCKDHIRLWTGQPFFSLESCNRSFFIGLSMFFYLWVNYITHIYYIIYNIYYIYIIYTLYIIYYIISCFKNYFLSFEYSTCSLYSGPLTVTWEKQFFFRFASLLLIS